MNQLRYIYLRDLKKQPVACIAVAFDRKRSTVSYNLSVLNPLDRFDRDVARDLAVGRLCRDPVKLDLSDTNEINSHVITRSILKDMLSWDTDLLPSRARKAGKRWLITNAEDEFENSNLVQLFGGKALRN